MVAFRLQGSRENIELMMKDVEQMFDIKEVSDFKYNRKKQIWRLNIKVEMKEEWQNGMVATSN